MSVQYRVTCTCGKSVLVGEAQAGATVACGCGAPLPVPMLRELRKLPREEMAAEEVVARNRAIDSGWNPRQATLFVLGVATILSLVVTAVLYVGRSRLNATWSPELQKYFDDETIDHWEPMQIVHAFTDLKSQGLGEAQPTTEMLNRETYYHLGNYLVWSGGLTAACAAAWAGVAFGTKRKAN